MPEKALPSDDSDYSMPGRAEESGAVFPTVAEPRYRSRGLIVAAVVFGVVAAGFFSYYFVNQDRIDSEILDSTTVTLDEVMAEKYNVGRYGSDHAHAAMVMFVESERINFGLPNFQLKSKYIHFENHNPYQIHKHANRVPLEMLFESFGMRVGSGCIVAGQTELCEDVENSLRYFVNGKSVSDISGYEIMHGDRILVFFGNEALIGEQLRYLGSLVINDVPKSDRVNQDREIFV